MITMASKLLSTDQQNFVRLGIGCVDLIKLVLKDILRIQIQPEDLYTAIKSCAELTTGRYQLRPEQKMLSFFPLPLVPDYDKFDVSLLYTLLRNLCPSVKPKQGWGKSPTITDIQIGDDIERLRIFRNGMFAHLKSTTVPDTEFTPQWQSLEIIIQRIQAFVISKGYSVNYEKELANTAKSDFGFEDMQKYKILLEGMMHLLKQTENEDIPRISINGEDKVLCGKMALFEAKVEHLSKSPSCSIVWQRLIKNDTKQIDTSTEKYEGSTKRRLIINAVSKEDEGEYRAVISWERDGQIHNTTSNSIFLDALGERPNIKKLSVTTGEQRISLHYEFEVSPDSPKVHDIRWTRNGEVLNIGQNKIEGGGLMDKCLTITSPTDEDAGNYTCIVTNAVGDVSESLALDFPEATISTENTVCYGNEIRIYGKIISCPKCEGAVWQKSSDSITFETIDVGAPKYYGTKQDPNNPVLILRKAVFDDKLYYRLLARNKIGKKSSNTVFINVTGGPPNIANSTETSIKNHSVSLICEVFLYENSPSLKEIVWMKNDAVIDITRSGGKYTGGTISDATLVINDVNEFDAGSYLCKASNALGTTAGNVIVLSEPELQVHGPERTENGTFVYKSTIISCPGVSSVQWSKKNKESDEYTPIDVNEEEYRGTSNCLPHPELVIKQIPLHNYSFQIEAKNFIGTSTKKIPDESSFLVDNMRDNRVNRLAAIFNKKGSPFRFNNLRCHLIREIPDNELDSLKESLKVITSMELSAENVTTVKDFFKFLLDEGIFNERNVIIMQSILRSIERPDLERKCAEYAMKDKQALCYFEGEKVPGNEYEQVQLHVVDDIDQFTNMDSLLATVAAIAGCDKSCIEVVGVRPESSFIIVISMKEEFARALRQRSPHELNELLKFKVDWIKFQNEVLYIARGTKTESKDVERKFLFKKKENLLEKLRGTKRELKDTEINEGLRKKKGSLDEKLSNMSISQYLRPTIVITSSITIPGIHSVYHISYLTADRLWVSDDRHLLQIDSCGHEILKNRIENDMHRLGGIHSVTEDGELLFIDPNHNRVQKMTPDGIITTLIKSKWKRICFIHSSHINGNILVGYLYGIMRYDRTGQLISDFMVDWRHRMYYAISITENMNGDIWLSNFVRRAVMAMDKSGRHRFDYTGQKSQSRFTPCDICTYILGQVLVCDCDNDNPSVHLLDQDGQFLCLLLTREHGLRRPIALCVDDKNNIYLGQKNSNRITVYKYLQKTEKNTPLMELK